MIKIQIINKALSLINDVGWAHGHYAFQKNENKPLPSFIAMKPWIVSYSLPASIIMASIDILRFKIPDSYNITNEILFEISNLLDCEIKFLFDYNDNEIKESPTCFLQRWNDYELRSKEDIINLLHLYLDNLQND